MIELRNVTVKEKKETLINGANIKLNNGNRYAICGDERMISLLTDLFSGVRHPFAGSVLINGFDMEKESKKAKSFISLLPSLCSAFSCMTVLESLLFVADAKDMDYQKAIRKISEELNVTELSHQRNTLVKHLSAYEKKRLSLAMSSLTGAEILILQAPFLGLSSNEKRSFLSILDIETEDRTVILTDTDPSLAEEFCDSVFLFEDSHFTPVLKGEASRTSNEEEEQI